LWEEIEAAYDRFLTPGLDGVELQERWMLVVHLTHHFKLQRLIKTPAYKWPIWPAQLSPTIHSGSRHRRIVPPGQEALLSTVGTSFLAGDGFGVPTRSALLYEGTMDEVSVAVGVRMLFHITLNGSTA
jgi:hypothetical protein